MPDKAACLMESTMCAPIPLCVSLIRRLRCGGIGVVLRDNCSRQVLSLREEMRLSGNEPLDNNSGRDRLPRRPLSTLVEVRHRNFAIPQLLYTMFCTGVYSVPRCLGLLPFPLLSPSHTLWTRLVISSRRPETSTAKSQPRGEVLENKARMQGCDRTTAGRCPELGF